ncbi:MAG: hypothetical protein JWP29_1972 [Rhodoferax sp.]|nr:hypothetical protein [Rhodoferax sp.]
MSRSGYSDDCDSEWQLIMWRGRVASATRGKRGQAMLRELLVALDALPTKRLIAHELIADGDVCAIGSLGLARGVEMEKLDVEDYRAVARTFGVAEPLVREIEWVNDEAGWGNETPEARWSRMRDWIASQIKSAPPPAST